MQTVIPTLRITDLARSRAFYLDQSGFTLDWEHRFEPGFPVFMQISREGCTLYLSEHTGDCEPGGLAYLYVADVDSWYADLCANGVQTEGRPEDQPWELRDFRVRDPDGNQLNIGTQCPAPSTKEIANGTADPDQEAIRALVAEWLRATAEGDGAALRDLMAEDVVFLTPGRLPLRGREAFLAGAEAGRQTIDARAVVEEVRVCGDLATCWTTLTITVTPEGSEPIQLAGSALSVLQRQLDGRWAIVRDANLVTPLRGEEEE